MSTSFKTAVDRAGTMPTMDTLAHRLLGDETRPGPPCPWWGLPQLRAMRADYLGYTSRLQREHGDVVFLRLGNERTVDLFAPDDVRAVLVDHADALVRWERGIEVFEQLMGQSVLVTEGPTWQRQRRMLMPAFTPRRVAAYAGLMVRAGRQALDDALPAGQAGGLVDMDALLTRMAMDVILGTLFGAALQGESAAAAQAVQVASQTAMREMFWPLTLPDWLPLPGNAAKRRALRTLKALVAGHIARRRAQAGTGDDLLSMLLALRDDDSGQPLSEREVFDQCMVSFQAGHETTATALLWWSRLMAGHPTAAERAAAELQQVLAGREPSADDLPALPWLTATLKEAMRLYPPVAGLMTRRAMRDIPLGSRTLPRGTMIRITPYVLQRDPRWFEAPEAFRPERFMPGAPELPRAAHLPFGTGPRVCLGQHFAMLEMTVLAALLLQRFVLALPADAPPAEPVLHVTLRPRHGLRLQLSRR